MLKSSKIHYIDVGFFMKKITYYQNKNVIYKRLHYFRKLRKLTQEQLVARLQTMNINLDQQALSKIENNRRIVTDYELACLCRALGVTEQEMLSDFYKEYPES